jgi:hypothetical protein
VFNIAIQLAVAETPLTMFLFCNNVCQKFGNLMAIGFARLEFVQRSAGKTTCGKSAYNAREKVIFEGDLLPEKRSMMK